MTSTIKRTLEQPRDRLQAIIAENASTQARIEQWREREAGVLSEIGCLKTALARIQSKIKKLETRDGNTLLEGAIEKARAPYLQIVQPMVDQTLDEVTANLSPLLGEGAKTAAAQSEPVRALTAAALGPLSSSYVSAKVRAEMLVQTIDKLIKGEPLTVNTTKASETQAECRKA